MIVGDPSEPLRKLHSEPLLAGRDSPFGQPAAGRVRKVKRKDNDAHCPF